DTAALAGGVMVTLSECVVQDSFVAETTVDATPCAHVFRRRGVQTRPRTRSCETRRRGTSCESALRCHSRNPDARRDRESRRASRSVAIPRTTQLCAVGGSRNDASLLTRTLVATPALGRSAAHPQQSSARRTDRRSVPTARSTAACRRKSLVCRHA